MLHPIVQLNIDPDLRKNLYASDTLKQKIQKIKDMAEEMVTENKHRARLRVKTDQISANETDCICRSSTLE